MVNQINKKAPPSWHTKLTFVSPIKFIFKFIKNLPHEKNFLIHFYQQPFL
jgi:predicted protein tyrosine phosphatase